MWIEVIFSSIHIIKYESCTGLMLVTFLSCNLPIYQDNLLFVAGGCILQYVRYDS